MSFERVSYENERERRVERYREGEKVLEGRHGERKTASGKVVEREGWCEKLKRR